jgi:hypothetical protein
MGVPHFSVVRCKFFASIPKFFADCWPCTWEPISDSSGYGWAHLGMGTADHITHEGKRSGFSAEVGCAGPFRGSFVSLIDCYSNRAERGCSWIRSTPRQFHTRRCASYGSGNVPTEARSIAPRSRLGETHGRNHSGCQERQSGNGMRDRKMHREVLESDRYPEIVFRPDRVDGAVLLSGTSSVRVHGIFNSRSGARTHGPG